MEPGGDAADALAIFARTGWDYRASWATQGQAWDRMVEELWTVHRQGGARRKELPRGDPSPRSAPPGDAVAPGRRG
jgi:hypothetical protein